MIGALMIISAFAYSGLRIAKMKRERVTALRELSAALGIMYAELGTRLSPVGDIALRLASSEGRYVPLFFAKVHERMPHIGDSSFCEIWNAAARQTFDCLRQDELSDFCALSTVLGTYELSDQLSAVELCHVSLANKTENAESKLAENERTSIGICTVLGVLTAVALI